MPARNWTEESLQWLQKVYSVKFGSVVAPSGLSVNSYNPVEGRRNGGAMLAISSLLPELEAHSNGPNGNIIYIYGDPDNPFRPKRATLFKGAHVTALQDK